MSRCQDSGTLIREVGSGERTCLLNALVSGWGSTTAPTLNLLTQCVHCSHLPLSLLEFASILFLIYLPIIVVHKMLATDQQYRYDLRTC